MSTRNFEEYRAEVLEGLGATTEDIRNEASWRAKVLEALGAEYTDEDTRNFERYRLKVLENLSGGGGGGGSSDLTTAEVTIIWSNPDIEEVVWDNCPAILEGLVRGVTFAETSPATILVPLYQNKCFWDQPASGLTLTGNIEEDGDGMLITGDCTITIS